MENKSAPYRNVDEYIMQYPPEIRGTLEMIRNVIREAAPEAEEGISYQMPAYRQNGPLVYFAAFRDHIGFFPTASGIEAFKEELTGYKWSKGTIQFPLGKEIPYDLVRRIVEFKLNENGSKPKKKR